MGASLLRTHITTDSGTYTVHVDGDDPCKPFALFLHGGPGFHAYGERQLLAGRFRAEVNFLWFDLLGCGEFQPASDRAFSWDDQIEDVRRIIRHFTSEPVHLIGHCFGTHIVHDLVRRERDLVRSALWYAPCHSMGEGLRAIVQWIVRSNRIPADALTPAQHLALERVLHVPTDELGTDDAVFALQISQVVPDWYQIYWRDRAAMERWLGWMAECPFAPKAFLELTRGFFERGTVPLPDYTGIPVHVMCSDSDEVVPWESHGRRLLEQIPHGNATLMPGAGHWLQFERPDEAVGLALEFFSRVG